MVCIYCAGGTQVTNSRLQRRANNIWRRRKCLQCGAVFTTQEQPTLEASFVVFSPENPAKLVPFQREKLLISIFRVCEHREHPIADAVGLSQTIISILPLSDKKLTTIQIAQTTHGVLSKFDSVAATLYKAHHLK